MGGFSYPDGFHIEADFAPDTAGAAGLLGIVMLIVLMVLFLVMAVAVVCYVLQSLGLQTIAKRRGIRNGWLAWLPVTWPWVLGSISDQYQYVVRCNITNRRKIMLGLSIATVAASMLDNIETTVSAVLGSGISGGFTGWQQMTLFGLASVGVALVLSVYEYICLFDLYRSCKPGKSVTFLVLSIVFPVTVPFFIFACRQKDLGMPPRKQSAPQQIIEAVPEAPAEDAPVEPAEVIVEETPVETVEETAEEIQETPQEDE